MSNSLSVDVNITVSPAVYKKLDQWQGKPLQIRTQKAQQAGMKLYVPALRTQAGRHNRTGKTQRGYGVRKLRQRNYTELGAYKASSNTWYKHFAIVGTSQGVRPDPYVDRVRTALTPAVVGFIETQIRRLA